MSDGKRHVHADLIIAWANGATIECKAPNSTIWIALRGDVGPMWSAGCDYRVKPKPPVKKYRYAFSRRNKGIAEITQNWYVDEADFINNFFASELGTPSFHWIQRIDASVQEFPA